MGKRKASLSHFYPKETDDRTAKGVGERLPGHVSPIEDRRRAFINCMREISGSTAVVRLVSRSDQSNQALEKHVARSEPVVGPTAACSIWTYYEASQARLVLSTAHGYSTENIRVERLLSENLPSTDDHTAYVDNWQYIFRVEIFFFELFLIETFRVEQ